MRPLWWVLIQSDCFYKKKKIGHMEKNQGWIYTEERSGEDTVRRWPFASQGEVLRRN